MPRSTAKSRKNNVKGNTCKQQNTANNSTATPTTTTPTKNANTPPTGRRGRAIKKETTDTAAETVTEQVFHRKSERRRVARDIFLVFEEQPSSRRSRGTNKKQPAKPKFGHLKVEDPIKSKGLLRDIKNEPKCYLTSNSNTVNINTSVGSAPEAAKINKKKNKESICVQSENKTSSEKIIFPCIINQQPLLYPKDKKKVDKIKVATAVEESKSKATSESLPLVARVNPIFLWVKQDDTRIVEVRCEDYDKRNRIRITKTSNGWRAIPRSDPTSSRVLKFYPTPLMKVKRENHIQNHETNGNSNNLVEKRPQTAEVNKKDLLSQATLKDVDVVVNNMGFKLQEIDTVVCNPLASAKKAKKKKKSSKRKKKSSTCRKISKSSNVTASQDLPEIPLNNLPNTNALDECHRSDNQKCSNAPIEYKMDKDVSEMSSKSLSDTVIVEDAIDKDALNKNIKILINIPTTQARSSSPAQVVVPTSIVPIASESESTYQTESQEEFPFQLCPKTGRFLSNNTYVAENDAGEEATESEHDLNVTQVTASLHHNVNKDQSVVEFEKHAVENKSQSIDDNTAESLEAKTKNLKDLLDDADLLQHCDDNANSDAELIDTLVKTSCENNLIQANEIIAKGGHVDSLQQKALDNSTNELVAQLITDVSDPPKCLSFNEAGEIEGFNGELFQGNSYMETFEKHTSSSMMTETVLPPLHVMSDTTLAATVAHQSVTCGESVSVDMDMIDISNNSKVADISTVDDSPKDLSYKKREEVCPQSESRSQCAVTSSSDVIKSPQHDDTSALASSSETLKTLILEQFLKLNALSSNQQKDPIDLGKQRQADMALSNSSMYSKSGKAANFIETVVIDDDDDCYNNEEPLKKRIRLNSTHSLATKSVENVNVKAKMDMMDKDPDPLTQLRLLIRNTQWKVPDPILVPKDRLSAVLASPAREIPLLITTRPELRLPEAFAYPEIIQNPNILVISMAQLEAILRNEVEVGKTTETTDLGTKDNIDTPAQQTVVQLTKQVNDFQAAQSRRQQQHPTKQSTAQNEGIILTPVSESTRTNEESAKCSHIDSSLASDINTATMAVLNQMLWLPYFGQISQDIIKSLKNPLGLQQKCAASLIPFYGSQINDLQNLEEVYKNNRIINQMDMLTQNESSTTNGLANVQQQESSDELTLFQKYVQHQMHNVLHFNPLKSADTLQRTVANTTLPNQLQTSTETGPHTEPPLNFIERKKQKVGLTNEHRTTNSLPPNKTSAESGCTNNLNVTEKAYNLRSSVAGRQATDTKQFASNNQKQNPDNKPRLTCKSLSNLIDPGHNNLHSICSPLASSSIPYVPNIAPDFLSLNGINVHSIDNKRVETTHDVTMVPPPPLKSVCSLSNSNIEGTNEFSKQQKAKTGFGDNIVSENTLGNNDTTGLSAETNAPLWHPLFGSNSKSAYSSPWQWTTVTASGE